MMFTPTNDLDDPISFMDPFSSLLSPFTCFDIPNYCYNDESVVLAQPPAESSNEPISASSKMDVNQGEVNGIVEQDSSRTNHGSINKQISRKGASKADRHSKIPTAQGLRDRRMRLSLDVARQFFKLQDMLSYEKPSQTIKWLLLQAEIPIEELKKNQTKMDVTNGRKGASSTSEGEEVVEYTICEKIVSDMPKATCSKEKSKHSRKNAFNQEAKELRKKARERARERTQKKKASMLTDPGRYFEIGEDLSSQSRDMRPSLDVLYKIEQQIEDERIPFGIPEDFTGRSFVLGANWSHLTSLNYHQEQQSYQFKSIPDFQLQEASWEPYSQPHV